MRCSSLASVAVAALLSAPTLVWADYNATLEIRRTGITDPAEYSHDTLAPGSSFSFDVFVTADFAAYAAQMFVQVQDEAGNPLTANAFQLTSITFDRGGAGPASDWGLVGSFAPDSLNGNAYTGPAGGTSQLITCWPMTDSQYVPAGESYMMTINGQVLPGAAARAYYFDLVDIAVAEETFTQNWLGTAGTRYKIDITPIPAPAALPLGIIGLGVVEWYRKRLLAGRRPACVRICG